jgi:hypothetical protein
LPLALCLVAITALAVYLSQLPPAPLPQNADPSLASASRARDILVRLLGDQAPHPTGSAAQERVRQKLLAELGALGLKPVLQSGTSCGRWGVCARVDNVVARIAGREPGPALLLLSHYDSVPAGPGAGDDGSGVAVALEVARALLVGPGPKNPIVLLFSDGEEFGLLGAELWANDPRNLREIGAVINLEARGSSGPSLMFETGPGNLPLLGRFREAVARPLTSSAFYAVYKRMPNDTDFSVFKTRGIPGYNFAFIGNVERYHTSLDDLGHLELASLQHQADNALACARTLGSGDLRALSSRDDAVFFDLFARRTIVWPARSMLPASLGILALLVVTLAVGFRRRALAPLAFLGALFGWPLALALAAAIGFGLDRLLRAFGGLPAPIIDKPAAALTACGAIAIGSVAVFGAAIGGNHRTSAVWAAGVTCWTAAGVALAFRMPEASYLFLPTALTGALTGLVWFGIRPSSPVLAAIAVLSPVAVTAILWWPILLILPSALGLVSPVIHVAAMTVAASLLAPACAAPPGRSRWSLATAAVVVLPGATALALVVPHFSPNVPQRLSLALHQDADSGIGRVLVDTSWGPVPRRFRDAGFDFGPADPHPWPLPERSSAEAAPAPHFEAKPPELVPLAGETPKQARVAARLRSPRGAPIVSLHAAPSSGLREVWFGGTLVAPRQQGDLRVYSFVGVPAEGVELLLSVDSRPVTLIVSDLSPGLPARAAALVRARESNAVPSQLGDVTLVSRTVKF